MKNRWTRTDLAIESGALAKGFQDELDGVKYEQRSYPEYGILISKVCIENERGAQNLGRRQGTYVTIESMWLKENHLGAHQEILSRLVSELKEFFYSEQMNTETKGPVLVAGLGNRHVTADALGPAVVDRLLVTRHMEELVPDDLKGRLGKICAVAPGVMGQTGIETKDIIQGIVNEIKPEMLIVIDALATSSIQRMNTTIQISDSGISPGAGMGNQRMLLSRETLGIPVLSIGIPTVIDAATLVSSMLEKAGKDIQLSDETQLLELADALYVTPKDMDIVLKRVSNMIASALNQSLHILTPDEIQEYLY